MGVSRKRVRFLRYTLRSSFGYIGFRVWGLGVGLRAWQNWREGTPEICSQFPGLWALAKNDSFR